MLENTKVEAIERLQIKRNKLVPGTYWFEVYDKAISLALNPDRTVDDFFFRNLVRDSKRILKRQKKSKEKLIVPIDESNTQKIESIAETGLSPLNRLVFSNYIDSIKSRCRRIHPLAEKVFDDILDAMPIKASATTLGVSESLIKKLRVTIKKEANTIIFN